jgi:hypothetical protein
MTTYKVEITRDERWWMIHVPDIDGLTQARRISEISDMARSLIAISTEEPLESVGIVITSITVPGVGDIAALADQIGDLREAARGAEARAAQAMQHFSRDATRAGIPVRDVAELLDISPQRVSQLAHAPGAR